MIIAIIRATPRIAAKIEPTIIGVMFLLVAEFPEAMVGDPAPRELVGVASIESTRLGSEGKAVIEPARTVGWGFGPDGRDDARTKLEAVMGVGLEE